MTAPSIHSRETAAPLGQSYLGRWQDAPNHRIIDRNAKDRRAPKDISLGTPGMYESTHPLRRFAVNRKHARS
jgi:hypothetical protein